MLARKFPALRAGIILSSKRKPPLRLSASGGRWRKPGIKKRLREHGALQPFPQDRAILAQIPSWLLTLRLIGGRLIAQLSMIS